jgi:hypothetical protein
VRDSTAGGGASPRGAPAAAPPASLATAVPAGRPHTEPSRTPDVAPPREPIVAELETRARGDLHRLDGLEDGEGSPMGRVASLFMFLAQEQCAGGTCEAAQRVTEAYLRARAAVLRTMLDAFLASEGAYDGTREYQALQALHADVTAELATLAAHVPMLAQLPDILATTLRVPDYLEAPADEPRARP